MRALDAGFGFVLGSADALVTGGARSGGLSGLGFKQGECVGMHQRERGGGNGVGDEMRREAGTSRR